MSNQPSRRQANAAAAAAGNQTSIQDIQNAIGDLAAQVQALAAAAAANAANQQQMQQQLQQLQQQQAGGGAQATVTFSTTPGTSNQANIIDYGTRYGMALYDMGTKPLFDSEEDKFNLDNDESLNFEKAVERRARAMGWYHAQQGILTFTVDGESLDLITDYGRIDIGEIKTQSEPIYLATGALKNQRAAQNNDMMHTMLLDSLTKAAKTRVQVFKDEYEFGDGGTPEVKVIVAAALYKIIMRLTTLDTKSTNKALRDTISDLPNFCLQVLGDVDKIHTRFNNTYAQLKARGEDVNDKEGILFSTYAQVPDKDFRDYMKRQKDDYLDNSGDMKNADYLAIMKKAASKFNSMKQDPTHQWGQPSEEDQKVIALEALLDKNLKLTKELQQKLKQKGDKDGQKEEGGGKATKTKNKKNNANKTRQKEDEAWKKVAPKDNEPKSKQIGKKTWNWCMHHQAWCIHKSSDCKLGKKQQDKQTKVANSAVTEQQASNDSATQINPSYAAMLAQIAAQSE